MKIFEGVNPGARKYVGFMVICMSVGYFFIEDIWFLGILGILLGMWIFNPYKKGDNGDQRVIPSWLGAIILLLTLLSVIWIFGKFF